MSSKYISEIQGLRTLAALLVAVYHIWFGSVSGGVDVFFVVSAYFIAHTLSKKDALDRLDVFAYYSKTLRRVLPSFVVVFCFTCLVILLFSPFVAYKTEIKHAVSTFLFVENWYLSFSGADYLRQTELKSLFQQFWALSVQVQLYVIVPLLYLAIKKAERVLAVKGLLLTSLIVLFITSFSYSVIITKSAPQWAYFDTFARAWEFIAGLILFHIKDKVVTGPKLSTWLNHLAVLLIVTFGLYLGSNYKLPGLIAVVPVLSACLIIVTSQYTEKSLLRTKVLTFLGNYSFAFYLWHWPLFLILVHYMDVEINYHILGISIILASLCLAYLTTKYIETPIRTNKSLNQSIIKTIAASCFSFLVPGLMIVSIFLTFIMYEKPHLAALNKYYEDKTLPELSESEFFPHGTVVKQDMRESYSTGCEQNMQATTIVECVYGAVDSEKTIVLVGGSHAAQWLSSIKHIAREKQYRLILLIKSACSLTLNEDEYYKPSKSCLRWNQNISKRLVEIKPDYIITTVSRNSRVGEYVPRGYIESWNYIKLNLPNSRIVGFRDNPWFDFDPPFCLATKHAEKCEIPRAQFYNDDKVLPVLKKHLTYIVDLSPHYCLSGRCTTINSNRLVKYKDPHHLTKSYVLALTQELTEELDFL